jgi:RNA polymerase sigma factor (sigma-70 family)
MIAEREADLVDAYLHDETSAVEIIDGWIHRAASAYRRRLSHQWDDLIQDLRVEVLRLLRAGSFRGQSRLRTYLWRVVSHSCLDRIRHLQRWQWAELEEAEGGATAAGNAATPGGAAANGGRLPAWSSSRDLLLRVLHQMPKDCRRLWNMLVAGSSYREMSRAVGVAEGTLRVRVLRCRQKACKVRRELSGDGGEES